MRSLMEIVAAMQPLVALRVDLRSLVTDPWPPTAPVELVMRDLDKRIGELTLEYLKSPERRQAARLPESDAGQR